MPAGVALGPIYTALKALMAAHAPLTSLISVKPVGVNVPAIYDDGGVPQRATMPYVVIGAGTQVPFHTLGAPTSAKWGWNCTLQIKPVASASEATGLAILDAVGALLYQGRELTVAGYGSAWCDEFNVQPTLVSTLDGVVIREWPAILRVLVHDS